MEIYDYESPKTAIRNLVNEIFEGQSSEEIIESFEAGAYPALDNVQAQMALATVTERLGGGVQVEKILTSECANKYGTFQVIGIKAFVEFLRNEALSIQQIENAIKPEDYTKENVKGKMSIYQNILNRNLKTKCIPVEKNTFQDFGKYKNFVANMNEHLKENLAHQGSQTDATEQESKLLETDNVEKQTALLNVALRIAESSVIQEKIINELVRKNDITKNLGESALRSALESVSYEVSDIRLLIHPSDFQAKKFKQKLPVYEKIVGSSLQSPLLSTEICSQEQTSLREVPMYENKCGKSLQTPLVPEEIYIEDHKEPKNLEQSHPVYEKIANKSLQTPLVPIESYTEDFTAIFPQRAILRLAEEVMESKNIGEVFEKFENGKYWELDNIPTQMALTSITERLGGEMQVENILATEFANQYGIFQNLGIRAFVSFLANETTSVEDVQNAITVNDFEEQITKAKLTMYQNVLERNLKSNVAPLERNTFKDFGKFKHIVINMNKHLQLQEGKQITKIIASDQIDTIKEKLNDEVQAAYLNISLRILEPSQIEQKIINELTQDKKEAKYIGEKILKSALISTPYSIQNVHNFIHPSDFQKHKLHAQFPIYEKIVIEFQTPVFAKEIYTETCSKTDKEKAVLLLAEDLLEGNTITQVIENFQHGKYQHLDNITAQMALVNITERLGGAAQIEKILTSEFANEYGVFQTLGIKAFSNFIINEAFSVEQVQNAIFPEDFSKETAQENFATYQQILQQNLKSKPLPLERSTFQDFGKYQCTIASMKKHIGESNAHEIEDSVFTDQTLKRKDVGNAELQIACVNVALRICDSSEIQDKIVSEIVERKEARKVHFGEKALKTALESSPYTVADIRMLMHPSDFTEEKLIQKVPIYEKMSQQYQSPLFTTESCEEQIIPKVPKRAILSLTDEVLEGKNVSEIVENFQHGDYAELDNVDSQMALASMTERLGGQLQIESILSNEFANTYGTLQTLGIKAFVSHLAKEAISIEDIENALYPEDFRKENVTQKMAQYQDVLEFNLKTKPIPFERSSLKDFGKYKGLVANMQQHLEEKATHQNSKTTPTERISKFDQQLKLDLQTAYLNVAFRICFSAEVQERIHAQTISSKNNKTDVGVKVLKLSLESTPYHIRDVRMLIHPSDFKKEKLKMKFPLYENISRQYQTPILARETSLESYIKMVPNKAIINLTEQVLEGKNMTQIIAEFEEGKFPELDNVAAQMALASITERLGGGIQIKKIITGECANVYGTFQRIGIKAFVSLLENNPISVQQVQNAFTTDDFNSEKVKAKVKILQTMLAKNMKSNPLPMERNTFQDFGKYKGVVVKMNKHLVENITKKASKVTSSEQTREMSNIDNDELQIAYLNVALRIAEPMDIHEKLIGEVAKNREDEYNIGVKALKTAMESNPYEVDDIRLLIHPSDFNKEKLKMKFSMYGKVVGCYQSPLMANEELILDTYINATKVFQAAKQIYSIFREAHQEGSTSTIDTISHLNEIIHPNVQLGLVTIAEKIFPLPIIQEIIPEEVIRRENFLECIGTRLLITLIDKVSYNIEDLFQFVSPKDFSHENLTKKKILLQNIHTNLISSPNKTEIAISNDYSHVKKAIQVANNIVQNKESEVEILDIIKYFHVRKFEEFDRPEVQMALVKVAKRISHPNMVEGIIAEELVKNEETLPLLGLTVLLKVAEINPYNVADVSHYFLAADLTKVTCNKQVAHIENISQNINSPQVATEQVTSSQHTSNLVTRQAIQDFLVDSKNTTDVNQVLQLLALNKYETIDNIPGQMAMLDLAELYGSAPVVNQLVVREMCRASPCLPAIGAMALVLADHNESIDVTQLDTAAAAAVFNVETTKQKNVLFQNLAYVLQTPKILPDVMIHKDFRCVEILKNAALKIVKHINEGGTIEEVITLCGTPALPHATSLNSQMALLSLAERLGGVALVHEVVANEMAMSSNSAISTIGFKALATACELVPHTEADVVGLISLQDLTQDRVQEKLAQILNVAQFAKMQDSTEIAQMTPKGSTQPKQEAQLDITNKVLATKQVTTVKPTEVEKTFNSPSIDQQVAREKMTHQKGSVADKQEAFIHDTVTKTQTTKSKTEKATMEPIPQESVNIKKTKADILTTRLDVDKQHYDKIQPENIGWEASTTSNDEKVELSNQQELLKTPIKSVIKFVDKVKTGMNISEAMTLLDTREFEELKKIESQVALLNVAKRIGNAPSIHEVIVQDLALNTQQVKSIGIKAIFSALEENLCSTMDVVACFKGEDFDQKTANATLCHILSEAHQVKQYQERGVAYEEIDNRGGSTQQDEKPIKAIKNLVEQVQHGKSITEILSATASTEVKELQSVEAQMAMVTVVQRLGCANIVGELVLGELQTDKANLLNTVGFRALQTFMERNAYTADTVIPYFDLQDFHPMKVQERIAMILHMGQQINRAQETKHVPIEKVEGPMKAIADIKMRIEHGASVNEVNAAYQAHEFPELEKVESQMALLKAVERVGHTATIQQVLTQDCTTKHNTVDIQDIGFKALISTLTKESFRVDEVITQVQPEDFQEAMVQERLAQLVTEAQELDVAQELEVSSEYKKAMAVSTQSVTSSQVSSEMNMASTKQIESQVQIQTESSTTEMASSMEVQTINEGDTFYALATFVSETGEAMNLVEGERVHVLEWNNQDWWYVRKHLTEETGWVPAQYLKDEETYTMYVQKKLVEKIEKLPVFEKPKGGEKCFAPKITEKVKSQKAPDGCQVEFVCKVEGLPRPQITWFRQTAIIKPSHDFQIYYDDNNMATLVIKEVFPEDAGTFTCVAKNCVGFASSSAELVVEHPLSDHGIEKHDRRSLSRESSLADIVEGIPPTFAQRPQTKNSEEGGQVELECRFVAIPEAEVHWLHNKQAIKMTERVMIENQTDMHMYCSILRINNVTKSDEGTYEVTAKNREGEATNTLVLNVSAGKKEEPKKAAEPPLIVKALTPTICKVGESVKMETVITGSPKPKLKWYHNSKHFKSGKNVTIKEKDNIYTLSIAKTELKNDGDYTVKAENEGGSAQTSANLCVQDEVVEIITKLEDKEIKEKESVNLIVEVSSENTDVKWHKDGQTINDKDDNYKFEKAGKKHSLIIQNATVHHEGEYVCSVGEQECSCEVSVIELAPEFTKKLTNVRSTCGEKVAFEIEISKGDAKTKWFKNGAEIEFNEHIQLIVEGKKQRLEVYNVEMIDGGEISCSLGDKQCDAKLEVEEPKVNFVGKLPATTTGSMGQDVKITVKLTSDTSNIKWLKDGENIKESNKYVFETDGVSRSIIIKNATIEDVAQYMCVAENVRTFTELDLEGKEEKLEYKKNEVNTDVNATKGDDVTFTVPFTKTSAKKPSVQWFFNGSEIHTSEKFIMTVTKKHISITIKQVEVIDCGMFVCKLKNSVSEISVEFKLSIKDKPSPPRGPAQVVWKTEDTLHLQWVASENDGGSKITEYIVERKEVDKKSWKQVGTSVQTNMEIVGLQKESSYNFRIIAKNAVGCSEKFIIEETFTAAKADIKKSLPGSPSVSVTDVTSRSVTLAWNPPSDTGGVHLTGYIIEKRISTSETWERVATVETSVRDFTVENLKAKTEFFFRVSAENEVGVGEATMTEKVSLQTHARVPSHPTAPLEIIPLGPHSLTVEWGAPESDGGAPLEGYKIAVRDSRRQMWMEVGRVGADIQKSKVQDLAEGHEYFIRIFAKNEVGFSDPLENEEPFKVVRPPDYTEEYEQDGSRHGETPSLSFSNTETLSSWMREAGVDADISSYTKTSVLRRDEYFFRIWYYASKLFK